MASTSSTRRPLAGLFARRSYDRDAPEYASVPADDVSEHLHPTQHTRNQSAASDLSDYSVSEDASAVDREVLREEEEREKLLSKGLFGSVGRGRGVKIGKKLGGRRKRVGEVAEMMGGKRLGMEEGGEYGLDSGEEYEEELEEEGGLLGEKGRVEKPRRPTKRWILLLTVVLLAFLIMLIFASLALSRRPRPLKHSLLSNGTHLFHPTTLLISLDGMRADFLSRHLTPTLSSFINSGVSPSYMTPSFPSVTFPNHWTLVTGLYPESHGIVGNSFWDPSLEKEFYYTDPARSLQHEWWGGEPIWMTAEKAGLNAAVHMWPGSEAPGWGATVVDNFNGSETLPRKVDRILQWLDMPIESRPQLIAAYVPDVDVSGHRYGPNTTQTDAVIRRVDDMLHELFLALEARNLTDITNIVVVSDHGMASTDKSRLIYLDDLVNTTLIEHTDGWPLYGLRPFPDVNTTDLYLSIAAKAATIDSDRPGDRHWDVYLRDPAPALGADARMPERYHFSASPRIAPLWIIPEAGYAVVSRADFNPKTEDEYHPRGIHGYDNLHPLMRAIFVARGPAFRHLHGEGKEWLDIDRESGTVGNNTKGVVRAGRVRPFGNTEVYRMLCESLGLEDAMARNNATLKSLKDLELLPDAEEDESSEAVVTVSTTLPPQSLQSLHTASTTVSGAAIPATSAPAQQTETPAQTDTAPEAEGQGQDKGIGVNEPGTEDLSPEELENPDLDFWEYLRMKAQRLREKLQNWWQQVWATEQDENAEGN